MKPNQLATLLDIGPSTLRLWAGKEYAEFLSPSGAGINGARRSFNDRDARIIAWIAQLKAQNTPASDIYATLKSAQAKNWHDLPPLPAGLAGNEPIAVVPREAVEERVRALQERYETQLQAITKEREELKAQINAIQQTLETSRQEAETARRETDIVRLQSSEAMRLAQQQNSETMRAVQERLAEINAKEAEIRGQLRQYTVGGKQLNGITLVVAALIFGILITLTIMALTGVFTAK